MRVVHSTFGDSQARTSTTPSALAGRRYSDSDAGASRRPRRPSVSPEPRSSTCPQHSLSAPHYEQKPATLLTARPTLSDVLFHANSPRTQLDSYLDLRHSIHALRDQVSRSRLRWNDERNQLLAMLKLHLDSVQELVVSFHEVVEHQRLSPLGRQFSDIHQQCTASLRNMETQDCIISHREQELSSSESSLIRHERDLDKMLMRTCHASEPDLLDSQSSQECCARSVSESGQLPPLLQKFYHRSGDVGIQEDRLEELDIEHEHTLEQRAFFADRGDILDKNDDAVQKEYEYQRQEILSALAAAQQDVGVLSQACQAVGIDTEARRYVSSSESRSQDEPLSHLENLAADMELSPFSALRSRVQVADTPLPPMSRGMPHESYDCHLSVHDWLQKAESTPFE